MALDYIIVWVIVASVTLFAVMRGDQPERLCAAIIAFGVLADAIFLAIFGPRGFHDFDVSRIGIDLLQTIGFFWIALRANRTYPLFIVAAQLVAIIGSMAAALVPDGMSVAFWAMTQAPLFLEILLLGGGTIAHAARVSRIGPYNAWSPSKSETIELL
ncbi:hypothetical protein [Aurantiacibacter sp. MUD61]|uniref:hypothetical protein n=1 Tax=Aurantiacibacter sp. MUD61 TaxID=3009083 RepID=UPI0022F06F09|nr:hypothetical protein [Aurantiacibacter sp. MUD61]